MAKVASTESKLAALRLLRDKQPSPQVTGELALALGDRSNLVVAAAAGLVADLKLADLASGMEEAFARFLVNPGKTDAGCRAKIAIVAALDKLEHAQPNVFLTSVRHVQPEPVWGGSVDTAAPLRAAGIIALVRMGQPGVLPLLVDSLTDPEKEVRVAAARALGWHGGQAADLLLRLKARVGDQEAEVVSECLSGLLRTSPEDNLPFVSPFAFAKDVAVAEAAILALGESRRAEAFDVLKARWQQSPPPDLHDAILLALAILHRPAATELLLEIVAAGPEDVASAALAALKIHRHDPRLQAQLAEVVRKNGNRALGAAFAKDFAVGE